MKIYDCVMFYNEFDLLDIRLEELGPIVDHFVIIEQELTHRGNSKPLYFRDRISESPILAKYKHKIINLIAPILEPNKISESDYHIEVQHRNYIQTFATNLEESIILISDLDEIPRQDILARYLASNAAAPVQLKMYFLYYGFHYIKKFLADTTVICRSSFLDDLYTPDYLKVKLRGRYGSIPNAGWHLSYYNTDPEQISIKIKSILHREYDLPEFTSPELIAQRVAAGVDLFDRTNNETLVPVTANMNIPLPRLIESNPFQFKDKLPMHYLSKY